MAFALLQALLEVEPETPANFRSTGNLWERLLICCKRSWPPHKVAALKMAALDTAALQRRPNGGAMASSEMNSSAVNSNGVNSNDVRSNSSGERELHLLLAPDTFEPLWKSLFRQMDEFFFPVKLPPLALESKPEPVRDLWGFYNHKKDGVLGSTAVHILIAGIIIIAGTVTWTPPKTEPPRKPTVVLVSPSDIPALQPGKTLSGGGGGGGDHDVLKASVGRLPTRSLEQITPPAVVLRAEQPKLAVESTIVIPPEVTLVAFNHFPDLGVPTSHATTPSNGQGELGGMGDTGRHGGIGPGTGPGYGPGDGGGTGGDSYHRGQGASDPSVLSQVDPEFSEEARKAKFQGLCVLTIIVEADGTPSNIRIRGGLGMGLDEKAIEAVKKWRFRPSMKDGHPVRYGPVEVDVDFHLY